MTAGKLVKKYRCLLKLKRVMAAILLLFYVFMLTLIVSAFLMVNYLLPLMKATLNSAQGNKLFTAILNHDFYGLPIGQTIPILGRNIPASNFENIYLVVGVVLCVLMVITMLGLKRTEQAIAINLGRDVIIESYQNSTGQKILVRKLKSDSEWCCYFKTETTTNFQFLFDPKRSVKPKLLLGSKTNRR